MSHCNVPAETCFTIAGTPKGQSTAQMKYLADILIN